MLIIGIMAVVVLLLVVGVLVLHHRKDSVVVLGDSITEGGASVLRGDLGDDYAVHVDGRGGYRVAEMLPAAENASFFPFEQVVINLGTNDVLATDQDLDESIASLQQMISMFGSAECIHIVTINEHMGSVVHDVATRARRFNSGLRSIAATNERVRLVDWNAIVEREDHPERPMTTDTVHPTPEGQQLLADAYEASLGDC